MKTLALLAVMGGVVMSQTQTGLVNNQLRPCPSSPNCVCSQHPDNEHFIEPLKFSTNPSEAKSRLRDLVLSQPRTELVEESEDYLHFVFTTALLRFKDDVEFLISEKDSVIHVRSASRVGYSDFGTNRKRIEQIRKLW